MQEKRIAPLIVKKIFEEAEFTVSTLALMSSKNTVAAVYTGLVSFFVFDSNMDNDLIQRLKMEYQSRLLRDHSGSEFENYSHTIDDAYARFSLNGVRNAYTSTEWNEKNAAYYVDTVIEMIGAQSNDYNKELVMETVSRLYRAVTKDYSKEKGFFGIGDDTTGLYHTIFASIGSPVDMLNARHNGDSAFATAAV